MEWIVVFVLVILLATLFVLRRSGWPSGMSFTQEFQRDLTARTRMAEDDVRHAINRRDEDVAP